MTYDLAVWEGPRPADDVEAGAAFQQLYAQYIGDAVGDVPPTARIRGYVEALLDRWIDLTEDDDDLSPWADGPLIDNAQGPIVYFSMVWSRCEEVSAQAAQLAADHGLNCFDPQLDRSRPPRG